MMIPKEDFSDVTLVIDYTYLTYLVIVSQKVEIVKYVISCDVSYEAMFMLHSR